MEDDFLTVVDVAIGDRHTGMDGVGFGLRYGIHPAGVGAVIKFREPVAAQNFRRLNTGDVNTHITAAVTVFDAGFVQGFLEDFIAFHIAVLSRNSVALGGDPGDIPVMIGNAVFMFHITDETERYGDGLFRNHGGNGGFRVGHGVFIVGSDGFTVDSDAGDLVAFIGGGVEFQHGAAFHDFTVGDGIAFTVGDGERAVFGLFISNGADGFRIYREYRADIGIAGYGIVLIGGKVFPVDLERRENIAAGRRRGDAENGAVADGAAVFNGFHIVSFYGNRTLTACFDIHRSGFGEGGGIGSVADGPFRVIGNRGSVVFQCH